jgi:type III secretion protein L
VSKKFFSLIKGESIHSAPNKKVVPASVFSELMEANEVLGKVKQEAMSYRQEVIKECEALKERAQREGFEEGFKQWVGQVAEVEAELSRAREEFERIIVPVALKAAKKIVGREIELSEETIADIVASSLRAVSQHKKIVIYVNRRDLEILEKHRPKLKQVFETLESMSIRERSDIAQGGCVIETEGGIINAQFENQWRALENALEVLFRKKESRH